MTGADTITQLLRDTPLPPVRGDKNDRGTVVLVAGSETCPGSAVLAAEAAMRSGAGRVQVVSAAPVAPALGVRLPEVLVVPWDGGEPVPPRVRTLLEAADAVCIGPGLEADAPLAAARALRHLDPTVPVLLDARALDAAMPACDAGHAVVIAPNVAEAQGLLDEACDEPGPAAVALSRRLGAPVAVRGTDTIVADGAATWASSGSPGLGAAGSGDVLAGITVGLLGRGVGALAALGWAVATHARAGEVLGAGRANPGFLARELVAVIPDAMHSLS